MKVIKEYPEMHQKGTIEIDHEALGGGGLRTLVDHDFGIQIAKDGRVWICVDGRAFVLFKPNIEKRRRTNDN